MNPAAGYIASTPGQQKRSRDRPQQIVPVTIAQLLTAKQEDERFILNSGLEFSQFTFIGFVRTIKATDNKIDYEMEDFTGPLISVRHFIEVHKQKIYFNRLYNYFPINQ